MKALRLLILATFTLVVLGCSLEDPYEPTDEESHENLWVPAEYGSITEAVTAAAEWDTIRLAPGSYDESFTLPLNVSLFGVAADLSFINGQVTIEDSESAVRFEKLTVSHAQGSGLVVLDSDLQIAHCRFVDCLEAGVEIVGNCAVEIEGCLITGNGTGLLIRDATVAGHYWDYDHIVGGAPKITGSNLYDNGGLAEEAMNIVFQNISAPDTLGVSDNYWGDMPAGAYNADRTIYDLKDGAPHLNGLADTLGDQVLFKPLPHYPLDWEWDD